MNKNIVLIVFLLNSCLPPEPDGPHEIIACGEPSLKLCWISGYGNDHADLIPGHLNNAHYLNITNYRAECFDSYDFIKSAIEYKNHANDIALTKIGFCTKCAVKDSQENSEKWGAVRDNLLFSIVLLPTSPTCPELRIWNITYYINNKPHTIKMGDALLKCE